MKLLPLIVFGLTVLVIPSFSSELDRVAPPNAIGGHLYESGIKEPVKAKCVVEYTLAKCWFYSDYHHKIITSEYRNKGCRGHGEDRECEWYAKKETTNCVSFKYTYHESDGPSWDSNWFYSYGCPSENR